MRWTAPELEQARAIVVRLVEIAGRGRSLTQVALQLADEGLPVPGRAVLDAAIDTLDQLSGGLRELMRVAGAVPDADDVDRVVQRIAAAEPQLVRRLRRQLRAAGFVGDSGTGELSVLFTMAAMLVGADLDVVDDYALHATLHAFNAHGAVQPVGRPAGPQLVSPEAAELRDALARLSLPNQVSLLKRFPVELVHSSLAQSNALGKALRRVQSARPDLGHHLAAAAVMGVFDGAGGVVQRLVCWQLIRETTDREPDIVGLIEALDGLTAPGSAAG